MIYDKLTQLARYRGLSKGLDRGINFLSCADMAAQPMGRIELAGDDLYCNHFTYSTSPRSPESLFEGHERYLDLHILLSGREGVALAPVESLTEVEQRPAEDSVLYRGTPEQTITLEPGYFLLLFPGEGHLPKLEADGPAQVDKLVMKIAF